MVAQYRDLTKSDHHPVFIIMAKKRHSVDTRLDFPLEFMFHTHSAVTPEIELRQIEIE